MKKYYGFDGSELIYIGKYKDISPALEDSEKLGDFFYVTTLQDWSLFAQKIIGTLAISASQPLTQSINYPIVSHEHDKHNPITEFQALAFDFNVCNEPEKSAQETINLIKKDYSGLSDWKIEDVKE